MSRIATEPPDLSDSLRNMVDTASRFTFIPVIFAIVINLLHIFILSRKTMTSSSITSLLIGIAIVEILYPMNHLNRGLNALYSDERDEECASFESYQMIVLNWILDAMNDCFRRSSAWLGLCLAVIRSVSIRKAFDKRYDFLCESRFGWKVTIVTILLSSFLTLCYICRFEIGIADGTQCHSHLLPTPLYVVVEIHNLSPIGSFTRRVYLLVSGVFGKILPCFLFPVMAVILIVELRKARKLPGNIVNEKTSRIVIYMTVIFVIIEFPIGVGKLIRTVLSDDEDLVSITRSIEKALNMVYICLTATHSLICFAMSSQYRSTVREVLGVKSSHLKIVLVVEMRATVLPKRCFKNMPSESNSASQVAITYF